MAKSEIKLLNLNIDGEVTECRVPFTLGSLLGEKLSEAVTLTATFTADAQTVSSRYVYIRIRDARGLVGVRINGVEIGENLDTGSTVSLNIKNFVKQGENSVELQFTSLPDSGILGTLELLRFGSAMIDKIFVTETFEGDSVNIGIRVEALGSIDNVRTVATLVSSSGQMYYGGLTRNRGVITVKNPLGGRRVSECRIYIS